MSSSALTRRVIAAFDEREQRPWGVEASLIELVKQVGDLARCVMMAESYYLPDRANDPRYATTTAEIGDELADILYCLIHLADLYGIDLAERRRQVELLANLSPRSACMRSGVGRGQAARLEQALLDRAQTGGLVPQQRGDEPADKLLERIRANAPA